jgi:hypothetical protein
MGYNRYMANITFVSTVEFLDSIEECRPQPAKSFIPEWFKKIPSNIPDTVRSCPSFPDFFSQGYVLPMWSDFKLKYNKKDNTWGWSGSGPSFSWSSHANNQLIDYVTPSFSGSDAEFVLKAHCPWRIITPPGWSVLQLPLFYHFNKDWSVMPGVIDTDIHHDINQQVLYHGKQEMISIDRGDPFALYIPFKREKNKLNIRYQNEKDRKTIGEKLINLETKFTGSGSYRKLQRKRDMDV